MGYTIWCRIKEIRDFWKQKMFWPNTLFILVILPLTYFRREMRNCFNTILIAINISDRYYQC